MSTGRRARRGESHLRRFRIRRHDQTSLEFLSTLRLRAGITADNTLIYSYRRPRRWNRQQQLELPSITQQISRNVTRIVGSWAPASKHYLTDRVALRLEGLYGDLGKLAD